MIMTTKKEVDNSNRDMTCQAIKHIENDGQVFPCHLLTTVYVYNVLRNTQMRI